MERKPDCQDPLAWLDNGGRSLWVGELESWAPLNHTRMNLHDSDVPLLAASQYTAGHARDRVEHHVDVHLAGYHVGVGQDETVNSIDKKARAMPEAGLDTKDPGTHAPVGNYSVFDSSPSGTRGRSACAIDGRVAAGQLNDGRATRFEHDVNEPSIGYALESRWGGAAKLVATCRDFTADLSRKICLNRHPECRVLCRYKLKPLQGHGTHLQILKDQRYPDAKTRRRAFLGLDRPCDKCKASRDDQPPHGSLPLQSSDLSLGGPDSGGGDLHDQIRRGSSVSTPCLAPPGCDGSDRLGDQPGVTVRSPRQFRVIQCHAILQLRCDTV
jgi:hypothetical protein